MSIDRPPDNPRLALATAALSGLRPLRLISPPAAHCMGYANCCCCPDCMKRERGEVEQPKRVKQPWDVA